MSSRKTGRAAARKSFNWTWIGAAVAVVVIGLAAGALIWWQSTQAGTLSATVSVAEAARLRDSGAFILDVREQSEWDSFHIPGATLIPLGQLPSRLSEVPADKPVVVVCRSGNRSQQGRDILRNAGFGQVTSMAGGVNEWQAQGLAIATGP